MNKIKKFILDGDSPIGLTIFLTVVLIIVMHHSYKDDTLQSNNSFVPVMYQEKEVNRIEIYCPNSDPLIIYTHDNKIESNGSYSVLDIKTGRKITFNCPYILKPVLKKNEFDIDDIKDKNNIDDENYSDKNVIINKNNVYNF